MANLYYEPVYYGVEDVIVQGDARSFGLRIYYPSENDTVWEVPIRRGEYPLVVFAHGDRSAAPNLCPPDRTEDYKRWGAVLHLLARCGFVVAAPAMHDVFRTDDAGAARLEETVRWMRERWVGRGVLHHPAEFVEIAAPAGSPQTEPDSVSEDLARATFGPGDDHIPLLPGVPTALALVGHSWGVRACTSAAVRGNVHPEALAGVAGTFDTSPSVDEVTGAHVPTLLMAGNQDSESLSYLTGLWLNLPQPKHQVAILGVGHWDWFSGPGKIAPCDPQNGGSPSPPCPIGWKVAAELLVGFTTKYLRHQWQLPPSLLGDIGERPPITPWLSNLRFLCALNIRWVDPTVPLLDPTKSAEGARTLGRWPTPGTPW